jgi:hypothetical protein
MLVRISAIGSVARGQAIRTARRAACRASQRRTMTSVSLPSTFVSTDWLAKHMSNTKILDGSWFIPSMNVDCKKYVPGRVSSPQPVSLSRNGFSSTFIVF